MFKNYFKIAFRNIVRHKAFSVINIAGLAIGMTCSIFILLWVQNELSYDRFNKNANEIYRVTTSASGMSAAVATAPMAPELKAKLPEVANFARITPYESHVFETGNRKFEDKKTLYVDSTFLQVFSYPLLEGNPASALLRPDAVLITEEQAKKYFGNEDAIGKTLRMDNKGDVIVTGVLKNIPANSHLQFDCLMPMSAIAQTNSDLKNSRWDNFNFYTYLQLNKNFHATHASLAKLTQQINTIYKTHEPEKDFKAEFHLQPLTAIHLHSHLLGDFPGNGNMEYVNIFFIIAIFILVVACINFMNLATARSARRAKEVGLRKVVGANRRQLVFQFIGESILISFLALLIAAGLVILLLPSFNYLAG